ncbi:MAG: 30S ribosomal protein S20 [Clostridiaceae bacterium]|nr:30S ribosomal protein S20 [Clostridiaceae bacterium]
MANSRQASKRIRIANKKTLANKMRKSSLRTTLKKSRLAIENKDPNASELLKEAIKALDKAAAKNVIHKNNASRQKSKLTKAYNASMAK